MSSGRRAFGLRRRVSLVVAALLLVQLVAQVAGAPEQTDTPPDTVLSSALKFIGPGGADAVGPGPVDVRGFVRVVDGDTLDVTIRGHRVAVGLLGVHAPLYNTQCGAQATAALMTLTRGGIHFDDDPTVTFDSRLRRMYHGVALDGTDIAEQLARSGVAVGDGRGQRAANVFLAENEARSGNRGCAWRNVLPPEQLPNGRYARLDLDGDLGDLARGIGNTLDGLGSALRPSVAQAAPLATTFPAGFTQDVIAAGLNQPTAMAFLPDGRILVTTKTGLVRVIKNGSLLPTPFIDLTSRVNSYFDHGLLGIAADPSFATNGYVYLLYTYEDNTLASTAPKAGRFSRVTAVGDTASPASEVAILGTVVGGSCNDHPVGSDCIPTDNLSHAQGNIKFAADGSIFLTLGDGASFSTVDPMALRSQDLNSFAGKIVHILPSGLAAPENPFYTGDPTALRSKIWAYGVRNSYRFNIRPSNGRLYVGDVGWNDLEEINVVPPGVNLGWPCYEGPQVQVGYQSYAVCQALYAAGTARNPLIAYTHGGGSTAVTGGAFYTGTVYPAQHQGAYFYADYGQSYMRTLRVDANDNLISGPTDFATALDGPVDVEIGPDQNIYYLSINTSEIRRIRFAGNAPPNAVASVSPNNGLAPLTVQFSSAGSNDPENETLSYSWNFGDGTPVSTAANPSHTYSTNGTRTATLTVSDPNGSGTATVQVIVGNLAPTATITAPTSAFTYRVGDVISFSGSANDPETGALPGSSLSWQVIVHHCPAGSCHTHFVLSAVGSTGQFTAPDHGDDSYFEIQLTATDPAGLTGTASVTIHPQTSQLTIAASTAGMQVVLDGATAVAPLVHNSVVGSGHSIDTPSPQGNNTFASWSDGGAQHHNIVVGAANATYTASFNLATNTSLALDGGTAWARAPHDPKLNTVGDWTVEAWFKDESPSGYNHDRSYIVIKGATDLDGEANYLMYMEWNSLAAGVRTNWANQMVSASLLGTTFNAWHHAAASLVASTRVLTLYLDGVQVAQTTLAALSPTGSSYGVAIGRNGSAGGGWRGKLDDLRIWNVARTGAQIASSFRSELSGTPGGLVGNWKFDEGSGTVAADTTPNPMNAALIGTATWSADVGNGPPPPPPPTAIGALTATSVTNGSAQITWTTNNQADTQVDYGTTTSYGSSTTLDATLATSHSQQLTGLAASTVYHYRARSRDAGNTLVLSGDQAFTTAAPPPPTQITGVAPGIVTNTSAQIGWNTNNPADTQIEYGTTTAYGSSTTLNQAMITTHSQTLLALSPSTTYHYHALSRDAGGTLVQSGDFTFTTTNAPPAFSLGVTSGYAEAPLAPKLNITGDWTVESWFKDEDPAGYNHDYAYILLKGNTDVDSESPFVLGVQYGNLFAGVRTGWTNQLATVSLATTTTNRWHHVAATFVAATRTVTIYLDGAQVTQGALPARTTTGNTRPLEIGRNGNGAGGWRGKIDDLRIWNIVRTPAEIQSSYATELGTAPAALVGDWKFNEGTGANATDSSANPVTAILFGSATWSTDVGNGPPPPPPPTAISAVASTNVTNGSAQITWTTNNPADSQVDYGTTTSYGTSTTLDPARVTSHIQQITGLAASTLYHFHVRSTDAGGTTVTSADFTFTTAAPPPPTSISAVTSTSVTNVGATITWTTNNPADSQINYGTSASYGSTSALDPTLVTSHSQMLGALTPTTTYHYQVRSRDAGGTVVTSGDFTFVTTNAPPANSLALSAAAYAEAPNATKLNITGDWTLEAWFKDEMPTGYNHDNAYIVLKGNTDSSGEAPYMLGVSYNALFAGERTGWANYTVTASLAVTTSGAWHHAAATMVASTRVMTLYLDGVQVAQGTLAAQTSTGNGLPVEIGRNGSGAGIWRGKIDDLRIWNVVRTPTQISASYASELSSAPASLAGNWRFNEGVGTTAADATAAPQNAALLAGATWSSDIGNGPPPPPPPTTITAVTAGNITNGSAVITWTTNNPASSQVQYGTSISYGSTTTLDGALVTSHSQQISGLAASTLYHYRVLSTDGGGTPVNSGDNTFTTAAPPPPTTITNVATSNVTNLAATVTWTTNNPADSQVEYGTTVGYGATTTQDATLVTAHSQTVSGLTPNTLYHYRVRSRDAGGTLVLSSDATFTTSNAAPANSLLLSDTDYAEAPNATELNITGDWTLEAWFKDEITGGSNHDVMYILLKGNTDAMSDAPLMFGVAWNGLFAGERTGWANYTFAAPLGAASAGGWHHGAATFVAATRTVTLFVDGVQVGQGVLAARSTTGNAAAIEIGRNGSGAGLWRGKVDDVRIWNVARTAAQIAANYQTEFATAPAGLVANWQFDEGTGTTSADVTSPPENATLLGGAGWSSDVHP